MQPLSMSASCCAAEWLTLAAFQPGSTARSEQFTSPLQQLRPFGLHESQGIPSSQALYLAHMCGYCHVSMVEADSLR